MKRVVIQDGVKRIDIRAFAYCHGLQEVVIPNSVMHISRNAFLCCESLRTIIMPKGKKELFAKQLSQYKDIVQEV